MYLQRPNAQSRDSYSRNSYNNRSSTNSRPGPVCRENSSNYRGKANSSSNYNKSYNNSTDENVKSKCHDGEMRHFDNGPRRAVVFTDRIFVGQLPLTTEESHLRELFSNYGPIQQVRIVDNRVTPLRGNRIGFVTFEHVEDCTTVKKIATENPDFFVLFGKPLQVREAMNRNGTFHRGEQHSHERGDREGGQRARGPPAPRYDRDGPYPVSYVVSSTQPLVDNYGQPLVCSDGNWVYTAVPYIPIVQTTTPEPSSDTIPYCYSEDISFQLPAVNKRYYDPQNPFAAETVDPICCPSSDSGLNDDSTCESPDDATGSTGSKESGPNIYDEETFPGLEESFSAPSSPHKSLPSP